MCIQRFQKHNICDVLETKRKMFTLCITFVSELHVFV